MNVKLCDSIDVLVLPDRYQTKRVIQILKDNKLETVADLCKAQISDIKKIANIGIVTVGHISMFLLKHGLHFGMDKQQLQNHCKLTCESYRPACNGDELPGGGGTVRYTDQDLNPDELKKGKKEVSDTPSPRIPDWEQRLFDVAKAEYMRIGDRFISDTARAQRATVAAMHFLMVFQQTVDEVEDFNEREDE